MKILDIILFLFFLLTLTNTNQSNNVHEDEEEDPTLSMTNEQIKGSERQKKDQANLQLSNHQIFTFKLVEKTQFYVNTTDDQKIRGTVDIYWNENNIYKNSIVKKSQKIIIAIRDQQNKLILRDVFYTSTGFTFIAKKNNTYKIKFIPKGQTVKLGVLKLSSVIRMEGKPAQKDEIQKTQAKLQKSVNKLQNILQEVKLSFIMDSQYQSQLLRQTSLYFYFQIIESFMVIGISVGQILILARLFKNDIIV